MKFTVPPKGHKRTWPSSQMANEFRLEIGGMNTIKTGFQEDIGRIWITRIKNVVPLPYDTVGCVIKMEYDASIANIHRHGFRITTSGKDCVGATLGDTSCLYTPYSRLVFLSHWVKPRR